MKDLTKFQGFVRGCMIGLVLNFSMLPLVQGQPSSEACATEPAAKDPLRELHETKLNEVDAAAELMRIHREVYEWLFEDGWNEMKSRFIVTDSTMSSGAVPGASDSDKPFEFELQQVGYPSLDHFAPKERARIVCSGVQVAVVSGVLRRGDREVSCEGLMVTIDDGIVSETEFFPITAGKSADEPRVLGDGQPNRPPCPPGGQNCWGWLGDCTWCLAEIVLYGISVFGCIGTGPATILCILSFLGETGALIAGCINCARCLNGPRWATAVSNP